MISQPITPRILVVDDDAEIRELLVVLLSKHGFDVLEAEGAQSLQAVMAAHTVDLILLDIMLGDCDGFEICRQLRATTTLPMIMISAIGEPSERVLGLELGADDFIAKPFYSREVVARVKAVLRRHGKGQSAAPSSQPCIRFSGWTLQTQSRRLFDPQQVEVCLSVGEYHLLAALLHHANRVVTRDQLLSYLHENAETDVFDRSIDVQVCRLRKRIEINSAHPQLIKTLRGEGYRFDAVVERLEMPVSV